MHPVRRSANTAAGPSFCAVVVTYHPDQDVQANLRALRSQTTAAVVVDNGSNEQVVSVLRAACDELGFSLLVNGSNLGIATALNQGIRWARQQHATYIFFFDQDSTVPDQFFSRMLACFEQSPPEARLAVLIPRYVDRRTNLVLRPPKAPGGELDAATTSGSLAPLSLFDTFGEFAEELFIDGVDYEFSLRIRAHGMLIKECPEATLLHSPGATTSHHFGWMTFQSANYSGARRYYQTRNRIWVARRYWRRFLRFCALQVSLIFKDGLKVLLVETGRREKIRSMLRGFWDGVQDRTGPFHN